MQTLNFSLGAPILLDLEADFTADKAIACVALCTGHHFVVEDIFQITLTHENIIYRVVMF